LTRPSDRLERRLVLTLAVTAGVLFSVLFYLDHRDAVHVEVLPAAQTETVS